jgi:hypothetical protein
MLAKNKSENLLFWNKIWPKSSVNKWGNFCTAPWIFCCFCVKIPLFALLFHVRLPNLNKFQVPYISICLYAKRLHLNYFQGLGNTLLIQTFVMRHEAAFQSRQICGLFTDSLALSFILHRYNIPFLCIMCRMLWCNVSRTAPLLTHNCWWNIFYWWRATWNSAKQQQWIHRK